MKDNLFQLSLNPYGGYLILFMFNDIKLNQVGKKCCEFTSKKTLKIYVKDA
jgi:hypothetical protein